MLVKYATGGIKARVYLNPIPVYTKWLLTA